VSCTDVINVYCQAGFNYAIYLNDNVNNENIMKKTCVSDFSNEIFYPKLK